MNDTQTLLTKLINAFDHYPTADNIGYNINKVEIANAANEHDMCELVEETEWYKTRGKAQLDWED